MLSFICISIVKEKNKETKYVKLKIDKAVENFNHNNFAQRTK